MVELQILSPSATHVQTRIMVCTKPFTSNKYPGYIMGLPTFSTVVFFKFNKTKNLLEAPFCHEWNGIKNLNVFSKSEGITEYFYFAWSFLCYWSPTTKLLVQTWEIQLWTSQSNEKRRKAQRGECGNHGGNMYQQVSGRLVSVWHRRCMLYSRARFVELQYYFFMYGWNQRYFKCLQGTTVMYIYQNILLIG